MTKRKITESPIKIDLKKSYSTDDVRKLIKSVRDDRTWQLVITYSGIAYICDGGEVCRRIPPVLQDRKLTQKLDAELLKQKSNLIFVRFEGFCHGKDYVGAKAAKDDRWVSSVYNDLRKHWPKEAGGLTYIDF